MNISKEILDKIALSEKEYKLIVQQLRQEPGEMALTDIGEMQKPKIKVQKYREKI
jgi:hypothetical protein